MVRQGNFQTIGGGHMSKESSQSSDLGSTNSNYFSVKPLRGSEKVDTLWSAFDIFKSNWNSVLRTSIQEYKTLVLDRNNNCKCIVSFLENRRLVDRASIIINLMEVVLKEQSEPSIIIAQNHPLKPLNPDESVFKTSDIFYETAASMNIRLMNHIVLARDGFYVMPSKNNFSIFDQATLL